MFNTLKRLYISRKITEEMLRAAWKIKHWITEEEFNTILISY